MNKPLSYIEYFKGNKKKIFSLVISIVFSIILIGNIELFFSNSLETGYKIAEPYNHFTQILCRKGPIDEEFIKTLSENDHIERVIPVEMDLIRYYGLAINSTTNYYFMDKEDIMYVMDKLNIKVHKKLIPNENEQKLILSERLEKNNELKAGNKVNKQVEFFKGFKSDLLIGFVPKKMEQPMNSYIVFPKEGKLKEVNTFIHSINKGDLEIKDTKLANKSMKYLLEDTNKVFKIVSIIALLIIGIGLGISSYVHYFQRRKEFGIMSSIGYTHKKIIMKINKEIILSSVIGFIMGMFILFIEMVIINGCILNKIGAPPMKITLSFFSNILVIPLFASVFSLIPIWILLKRIDSISIIEGVN